VYSLAVFELAYGDASIGSALLRVGLRCGFTRMLPSIDLAWARSLAKAVDPTTVEALEIGPMDDSTQVRRELAKLLTHLS
jgi:hypothetical protein